MLGALIQIDARDASGQTVPIYLSSVDDRRLCHLDGKQWIPAIDKMPALRYDFFGGDFAGRIEAPTASFSVSIEAISGISWLRWSDARVRIWRGEVGAAWPFALRFDGIIASEPTIGAGRAQFTASVNDAWLDKPLLPLFAGTGGAEGDVALTGTVKPLIFGNVRAAPGILVNTVDLVYRVSAGPIQAVTGVYDRGVSLGASVGDYADYAALNAAVIANGRWATCNALGLVRLGAPAVGLVCFDVSGENTGGFARMPGAVIKAIAAKAGGTVNAANLSALDARAPWPLGVVLSNQTTARAEIQAVADSVAAVAGISWTGELFAQQLGIGAPEQVLDTSGRSSVQIGDITVQPVDAPFWRLATEAEKTWTVHTDDQISSDYNLSGAYSAQRAYRTDDLVTVTDGSSWVYIAAAPSQGNAPPAAPATSNAYWQQVAPPLEPANIGAATSAEVVAAQNTAAAAAAAAAAAQTAAAAASTDIAKVLADNLIDASEKSTLVIPKYNELVGERAANLANAIAISASATAAERTAYDNAVTALINHMATLTSPVAWNNTAGYTSINPQVYHAIWDAVYTTRRDLLLKSASEAAKTAEITRVSGAGALASKNSVALGDGTVKTGTGATATDANVLNSYAAIGKNRIPASDQTQKTAVGLRLNPDGAVLPWGLSPSLVTPGFMGWTTANFVLGGDARSVTVYQDGRVANPADGWIYYDVISADNTVWKFDAEPGKPYIASAYFAMHRCGAKIGIIWYTAGGAVGQIDTEQTLIAQGNLTNTLDPFNFTRLYKRAVAPSWAVSGSAFVAKSNTFEGQTSSYWWLAKPMLELAATDQSVPSLYGPGPPSSVAQLGYTGALDATKGSVAGTNTYAADGTLLSEQQLLAASITGQTAIIFNATYSGAISPADQLPTSILLKRWYGTTDVSSAATWSIASTGVASGAPTVAGGAVVFPANFAMAQTATVTVTATYKGASTSQVITVTRNDAAPPTGTSGGGTGGTTSTTVSGSVSTTSHATIAGPITVKTGALGQINLTLNAATTAAKSSPTGFFDAAAKFRSRSIGGSFADIGAEQSSAPVLEIFQDTEWAKYFSSPGQLSISVSKTGLAANTDYEIDLQARRTTATPAKAVTISGSIVAEGK